MFVLNDKVSINRITTLSRNDARLLLVEKGDILQCNYNVAGAWCTSRDDVRKTLAVIVICVDSILRQRAASTSTEFALAFSRAAGYANSALGRF